MIEFPDNPTLGEAFTHGTTIYTCVRITPIVWNAAPLAAGIPDAPTDNLTYGRREAAWKALDKTDVGLSNVNNTSDAAKPISTATQTALNTKEPNIAASVVGNYWRGDKTWQALNKAAVGLPNVDNTADGVKVVQSALYVRNGANGSSNLIPFTWADDGTQPTYVWGGNNVEGRVYNRANLSVNYANGAGYANNSGQVSGVGGWAYRNDGNNPAYLWCTEGDAQAQHLTTPGALRVSFANTVGSINGAGGGTVSGDIACAGMNCSNIRTQGGHWWRWHWNGDAGDNHLYAFVDDTNQGWPQLNSDERLKQDITYLAADTEAFMRLKPINFRWKPIGAKVLTEKTSDGLSAQNVRDCFPNATFGNFDEIPKENGDLMFPGAVDDRGVIAHIILQVQSLITRMAALEAK